MLVEVNKTETMNIATRNTDPSEADDNLKEEPNIPAILVSPIVSTQTSVTFDISNESLEDTAETFEESRTLCPDQSEKKDTNATYEVNESSRNMGIEDDMQIHELEDTAEIDPEPEDATMVIETDHTSEEPYFKCKLLEIGRYIWETNAEKQCYTKGCIWSPDGTCCLVPVHMDGMHLVELPPDLYTDEPTPDRPLTKLTSAVHVKEGGTVYDCAWYPFMNSNIPETCCWLASRQHEPIHMWDAFTGDLRATYRGYDDVDEIEAAISVIFSCDGEQVIGGYKKCIRLFNTDVPGRDCTKISTKQAISCFALTPDKSDIIATGSWNGIINLYDKRMPNFGTLATLHGHIGGVTCLKYSSTGDMLFSGARKDNGLCLWDMRKFQAPVLTLCRQVTTNQRIYIDLSPQNEWLISGDTTGVLRAWNLRDISEKHTFPLHEDSCNGANFHPSRPIIATSAGQYHFTNSMDDYNTEQHVIDYENSLVFWWIQPRHKLNQS